MRAAWERGERVRFLTLTDGSRRGDMTLEKLGAAWDDLAKLLRAGGPAPERPPRLEDREESRRAQLRWRQACKKRQPLLREYASVVEFGSLGDERIHLHVVATGEFVKQTVLSRWAKQCGFGPVAYIRQVAKGSDEALAGYAAKMAGYVSKSGQDIAAKHYERGAFRIRPVRTSRNWYSGGIRRAEVETGLRKEGKGRDRGPWVVLEQTPDGVRWVPPRR
jgi:hypothetical protein